jgi:hypothetical protein
MERVTPNTPTLAAYTTSALPHGRGWAVVATDGGLLIRLLFSGAELKVTEADVQAMKRGDVTGEALLERAGMALPSPNAPQMPIYGTTVSISAEGRRRVGQGQTKTSAAARSGEQRQGEGQRPLPRIEWIAAGAVFALMLLGWMIGVFG